MLMDHIHARRMTGIRREAKRVLIMGIKEDAELDRLEASDKLVIYFDRVVIDKGLVLYRSEKSNRMPYKCREVGIVWSSQM